MGPGMGAAPPRDAQEIRSKAVPPRDLPNDGVAPAMVRPKTTPDRAFWVQIDDLFYKTVRHAERAFFANLVVNLIIVAIGVLLLVSSLVYSWTHGMDVFSVAFASIGVADFVVIFFLNPQRGIHKTIGNLVQIQITYRTYLSQLESLLDYDYEQHRRGNRPFEDVVRTNEALGKAMHEAVRTIQQYIEETPAGTLPPAKGAGT